MDVLTSELWTAVFLEQCDLANQLISRGANVNESRNTQFGEITLLHYAAATGNIQCMHLLINHGANLHARDIENRTPLHWAVKAGDRPDIVEVLINEGAVVDARDIDDMTPLCWAVGQNFNESAQKLIARGASMEAVNRWGCTILHVAILYNNLTMVKMLVSHRVNLNVKENLGLTPLIYALKNVEILQLLLDNGADVNTQSPDGMSALLKTVYRLFLASFIRLLKSGARQDNMSTGFTVLHAVCGRHPNPRVAALLLEFGADLNARCKGKAPFEMLLQIPNSPSGEATARIVIREAVKREALGQLLYGYEQIVQSRENFSQFDQECREEIKRMRSEKIETEDSAISFFYIFSTDEEKLAGLARNKKFVTAFETSDYLTTFRIYAGELLKKFEVAKKRANFLMSVEDFLVDVLDDMLPVPIVTKIASYVKFGDIVQNEL